MLYLVIVGSEIGFWLVLLAGLVARYPLGRRRTGAVLLALVPVTDLVLLVATVLDLRAGATAGSAHGLGAAYLGFSVVFGPALVRWADVRFAHRYAGGPAPVRRRRYGAAAVAHEWREFGKAVLAVGIAAALLLAAIVLVDDPDRTAALRWWLVRLALVLAIWAIWPVAATIWPTPPPESPERPTAGAPPAREGQESSAGWGERGRHPGASGGV